MFENILIGIFGSLIASFAFILILYNYLRPKIEISEFIARKRNGDSIFYHIKIVNKTHWPLIDFRVEIFLRTPENTFNGIHYAEEIIFSSSTWK